MTRQPLRPRRLAIRQAAQVLVLTCLIALVICIGELLVVAGHERTNSAAHMTDLLDMAEESAAVAVWNLDDGLARQVLSGLKGLHEVRSAAILDDAGAVRAALVHPADPRSFAARLGAMLLVDAADGERTLHYTDSMGRVSTVGQLRIALDPRSVGEDFIAYALTTLSGNLLRSLLLGLVLAWSVHRSLARPIVGIAQALREVDPDQPMAKPIAMPSGHADDELGQLVNDINGALGLLQREQERLFNLATRDQLTGLPNRALLIERLDASLGRAAQTSGQVGILFLDLDRFKQINDTLGHGLGDSLLDAVGRRLVSCVKAQDTVGRLGGDEFMIVLEGISERGEVEKVAERIIRAISRVFTLERHSIYASTAVGIALYPSDGDNFETLLRAADTAMYSAKADGTGRLRFFSRDMAERAQFLVTLEGNLRHAIEYGQLHLEYQPKLAIDGRTVMGTEALLRWRFNGELIEPSIFIPLAEETGLIVPIGAWVLENACATLSRRQQRFEPVPVAINLSSRDYMDVRLPERIRDALDRHGVPAHLLELEITETSLMSNVEQCARVLSQLREIGVKIAVDDFGTGYSSLSYLRHLPIDVLKIDRAFVQSVPHDAAIASVVISLGKKLGLTTVAEGVETEAQLAWLAAEQCDLMQGWLVSRAVPRAEFEQKFLRARDQVQAG